MNSNHLVSTKLWKQTLENLRELKKLIPRTSAVQIVDELVASKLNKVKKNLKTGYKNEC